MTRRVNHPVPLILDFKSSATSHEPTLRPTGSVATYFQQDCPVCGRPLQIRVEHLGQRVRCSHCRCTFVCCDPTQVSRNREEAGRSALNRAERLLAARPPSRRPHHQSTGHRHRRDENPRR